MKSRLFKESADSPKVSGSAAFSLIELLVVLAIAGIMAALTIPALSGLQSAGSVNRAVSGISLLLNQSRSYAMAHGTYVWVGFAPDTTTERLTIGVVAGTTGQADDLSSPSTYTPINKLQYFEHFNLPNVNSLSTVAGVAANGDDIRAAAYSPSPLGSFTQAGGRGPVKFTTLLQYNPQGEATLKSNGASHWIQIGLQPVRGTSWTGSNVAVLQVATLTGRVQICRP